MRTTESSAAMTAAPSRSTGMPSGIAIASGSGREGERPSGPRVSAPQATSLPANKRLPRGTSQVRTLEAGCTASQQPETQKHSRERKPHLQPSLPRKGARAAVPVSNVSAASFSLMTICVVVCNVYRLTLVCGGDPDIPCCQVEGRLSALKTPAGRITGSPVSCLGMP